MHTEIHKKSWGHEIWLVNIPKYCGKILIVEQGKYCSLHDVWAAHLKLWDTAHSSWGQTEY